jgi:H+/Cl- antiporter ClcA
MIVTVITLKGGFKGGEIVPSFAIGASFGCLLGSVFGLSPSMCAAVFMIAFFGGVTNCPITALLIGFEMFGFTCAPFFLLAVVISFFVSGYYGLYHEQEFAFSAFNISAKKNTK